MLENYGRSGHTVVTVWCRDSNFELMERKYCLSITVKAICFFSQKKSPVADPFLHSIKIRNPDRNIAEIRYSRGNKESVHKI